MAHVYLLTRTAATYQEEAGTMGKSSVGRGVGVVAAGTLLACVALAAPAGATTYTGCVNKRSGALRIVAKGKKCKRSERRIKLAGEGPAGRDGAPGRNGANGANGTNGRDLTSH